MHPPSEIADEMIAVAAELGVELRVTQADDLKPLLGTPRRKRGRRNPGPRCPSPPDDAG
jgi:hypothetical protein